MTGEVPKVRGDREYQSSTSSSASSHSSVSYGGVPEADLEHLVDKEKEDEINTRRNERRADKWQKIFNEVVENDIKSAISNACLSRQATYEGSEQISDKGPGQLNQQSTLTDMNHKSSLRDMPLSFAGSQKQPSEATEEPASPSLRRFAES